VIIAHIAQRLACNGETTLVSPSSN
jgi:hypothetical protein